MSTFRSRLFAATTRPIWYVYSGANLPIETQFRRFKSSTSASRSRRASQRRRQRSHPALQQQDDRPKKILFQSLGCPRNFVDTEVMLGITVAEGNMEITQDINQADVVVVNTCGFLESAREESRTAIQDMIDTKKSHSKLLVTGCMVNLKRQQEDILTNFPGVDAILPSGEIDSVMDTIHRLDQNGKDDQSTRTRSKTSHSTKFEEQQHSTTTVEGPSSRGHRKSFLEAGDTPRFLATPPHYAYLKIAEGCRKQCSFCIIPKLKGRLQSKPVDQIVDEFQAILQHGTAKEVILIAQDLGDYGKDWQSRRHSESSQNDRSGSKGHGKSHLTQLLEAMLESVDQSTDSQSPEDDPLWIRLLYLYPDEITPDLLDLMERDPRITRYVDLPIQHSHDDILKAMRRKTTGDQIRETILQLRQRLPDICIRTSLMVGFPGETEEHFQHLLDFVREERLDNVGVFVYSNEEMAYSSRFDGHVSEEVKQDRYDRLMQAQWSVVEQKNKKWTAERKWLRVVVEGLKEGDPYKIVGRHAGQCPDIDGQVFLEGEPRVFAGERYWVEVTGYDGYDLIAKVLGDKEELYE
ncbi:MiaB-like tRNA modifying enzyme [Nitzschia inconspicua]|uniref:MiaB-like tRNA modifying enzyme n=1 Tax=Nitzschia inconspicua TaxID=303405 RepID=A0A9K3LPN5_9STRA|nr:MiaB-like tRNA modifying enzyme [Nitzschia inconspicua]